MSLRQTGTTPPPGPATGRTRATHPLSCLHHIDHHRARGLSHREHGRWLECMSNAPDEKTPQEADWRLTEEEAAEAGEDNFHQNEQIISEDDAEKAAKDADK